MVRFWLRQSVVLAGASGLLFALAAPSVAAQRVIGPRPELRICAPVGPCWLYIKRMVLPANSLGRTPNITATMRGLDWPSSGGYVQFAVPKPLDYTGGNVRVGVFYYIGGGEEGTIAVGMTPVGLKHGGRSKPTAAASPPMRWPTATAITSNGWCCRPSTPASPLPRRGGMWRSTVWARTTRASPC